MILFAILIQLLLVTFTAGIQETVSELYTSFQNWKYEANPLIALSYGRHDLEETFEKIGMFEVLEIVTKCDDFKDRAKAQMENKTIRNTHEMHHLKVMLREVSECLRQADHKGFLLGNIHSVFGIQNSLPQFFSKPDNLKLTSIDDFKILLRRMKSIPDYLDQTTNLLKIGIQENITHAYESMFRVGGQFEKLLSGRARDSLFFENFANMQKTLNLRKDNQEVIAIQEEALNIIHNEVLPAFRNLHTFIQKEYMKHLRPEAGVKSLPDGLKFYQGWVEFYTNMIGITPDEIHYLGLQEVSTLQAKFLNVAQDLGFKSLGFRQVLDALHNDPNQIFRSKEEAIGEFQDAFKKINTILTRLFPEEVLVPEVYQLTIDAAPYAGSPIAYYKMAKIWNNQSGGFYVNMDTLTNFKRFQKVSLVAHEANPGHHLQITYGISSSSKIPEFIKNRIKFWNIPGGPSSGYSAAQEGWGLYAESLCLENNFLDDDPYQKLGVYAMSLLRASRLVVDTGIHKFGWNREMGIDYMYNNSGLSYEACVLEVDRYISIPGQALSYKIGEKKIVEIRKALESELGIRFNIKLFHKAMLDCMGPLNLLEECVRLRLDIKKREAIARSEEPASVGKKASKSSGSQLVPLLILQTYSLLILICQK